MKFNAQLFGTEELVQGIAEMMHNVERDAEMTDIVPLALGVPQFDHGALNKMIDFFCDPRNMIVYLSFENQAVKKIKDPSEKQRFVKWNN